MIRSTKRHIRYFDWTTFILTLIIACIGLILIYSATYRPDQMVSVFVKKQALGIIGGIVLYFVCAATDYRTLQRWGYRGFIFTLALLSFTLIKGSIGMGAQRWINLGFFKFQPSELAKLFFPAFFTYYLAQYTDRKKTIIHFLPLILLLCFATLLVLKQPDLGTALLILFSGTVLLWLSQISKKFFIIVGLCTIISAPILYKMLKPYQKQRIAVFFGSGDSKKERYQIEQSQIAIGSGGLTGKGFLKGTQNVLWFLPESRTDFIFAVLCEEMGFMGALVILILYLWLFLRLLSHIGTIEQKNAQIFACGLLIHIIFSALINSGMVIGLLPIVGIPLPFLSYGMSNLLINFASLGCIASIIMRTQHN